jgi:hypothetical protein
MDRIRVALGEPKISYLGYSYGTYLGSVYATLFPNRTDRFVLDSAVDPERIWHGSWKLFGIATELRFPDFTKWAAARDATYHLGATPDAVRRTYFRIAAALDAEPVILPDLVLNGNAFREITRSALYDGRAFPDLAETWQSLSGTGTASAVRAAIPADNSYAVLYAIACNDVQWSRDVDMYRREVAVHRGGFPADRRLAGEHLAMRVLGPQRRATGADHLGRAAQHPDSAESARPGHAVDRRRRPAQGARQAGRVRHRGRGRARHLRDPVGPVHGRDHHDVPRQRCAAGT